MPVFGTIKVHITIFNEKLAGKKSFREYYDVLMYGIRSIAVFEYANCKLYYHSNECTIHMFIVPVSLHQMLLVSIFKWNLHKFAYSIIIFIIIDILHRTLKIFTEFKSRFTIELLLKSAHIPSSTFFFTSKIRNLIK